MILQSPEDKSDGSLAYMYLMLGFIMKLWLLLIFWNFILFSLDGLASNVTDVLIKMYKTVLVLISCEPSIP